MTPAPIIARASSNATGGDVVPAEDDIERVDEVGRGVDERAVEIEDDGGRGHGRSANAAQRPTQGAGRLGKTGAMRTICNRLAAVAPRPLLAVARSPHSEWRRMNAETYKRDAAAGALDFVRPGMRLGLGTGSTARPFVEMLGERVRAGLDVIAVPTSEATRAQAEQCGIRLTTLDETPELDLTVDGADEIAPDLTLIKGGGGALLREKIVAAASARMVVIADSSKWVATLGRFPLPIEVVPFGLGATERAVAAALAATGNAGPLTLRRDKAGHAFVTDGGHFILDAALGTDRRSALACRPVDCYSGGRGARAFHRPRPASAVIAGPEGRRIVERP